MSMPFRVGRVVGRSLSILASNAGALLLMALLMHLPVVLLDLYFTTLEPPFDVAGAAKRRAIVGLLSLPLQAVATGALTYGALQHLRGQVAGLAECSRFGVRRLLPVLAVVLASQLIIGLGLLAFILPGVFLLCVLFVVTPAAIFEGAGVGAAIARSNELTQGRRLRIFALLLAAIALVLGPLAVVQATLFREDLALAGGSRAFVVARDLIGALFFALLTVFEAVAYHDLRAEREGVGANEIASSVDGGPEQP